ncbi:host cell division inhibitor Icd-like protein [Enterobacter hormaechei]|uniref:host cell division inhibitor Icd-like protein n=1 Tax=Enterobacter hormaechei TaxID=158836 RepID=UPI000BA04BC7|nr:host cell division inhibitor Icd-like protein [Enterobacter hormaechei]MBT1722500.1 host cell division inhibitor Icd-like protein [Enterobacter hormaechei subsp. hoffmannii]MCL8115195.1 host cell division inhibitor Icd-like protein [Enterobacter hormaechei]MCM8209104.1 host cell division inhibitor Icd-like protein [Enterobacter hormaechei]MDS0250373.1 host cell division inhibitor Icd-like protein [Enterobacter hormaechei]OZP44639.1 Ash-like/host cell division inhibitor Icd-like protein [Ent
MMMTVQQTAPFSGLLLLCVSWYSFPVAAKSAAGRENPSYSVATPDAPCVFFCVYAYVHPLFTHRFLSRCCICVMVAQAGQPSGWPVSIEAGFSPPSGLPPERENSGGGDNRYSMEVALMATILTPSHPQFVFVFAAVRRADRKPRICMLRTVAGDEHAARLSLVRDYVLSFAGRLPVAEVHA